MSSQDRHGRGIRGPLATANPYGRTAPLRQRRSRAELFRAAVAQAVAIIRRNAPEAVDGVEIAIEDVPSLTDHHRRVPLSAAVESVGGRPARVVLFRRPIELRAASRAGLQILVRHTLVEQVSALTGRPVVDLDPPLDDGPGDF